MLLYLGLPNKLATYCTIKHRDNIRTHTTPNHNQQKCFQQHAKPCACTLNSGLWLLQIWLMHLYTPAFEPPYTHSGKADSFKTHLLGPGCQLKFALLAFSVLKTAL